MIIIVWSSKTDHFFKNQGVVCGHSWVWTSRQPVGPWTLRFSTNENKWLGAFIYRGRGLWMLNISHVVLKPLNRFFGKWGQMSAFTSLAKWILVGNHRASSAPPVDGWGWDEKKREKSVYRAFDIFHFITGFSLIHTCTNFMSARSTASLEIPGSPTTNWKPVETAEQLLLVGSVHSEQHKQIIICWQYGKNGGDFNNIDKQNLRTFNLIRNSSVDNIKRKKKTCSKG